MNSATVCPSPLHREAANRPGLRAFPPSAAPEDEPRQNLLLASLEADQLERWLAHLEPVNLPLGSVLHECGDRLNHVVFPTTAIVSLQQLLEDGTAVEVALVGRDGMVGVSALMGSDCASARAVVQSAGRGLRAPSRWLQQECEHGGPTLRTLLRYTQSLMTQIGQTALCNRRHSVGQQLCRCLLRQLDLRPTNEFELTHELIAGALGVRREGVTEAAGQLNRAGLISYRRGRITVHDRHGLEQRSCECYAATRMVPARATLRVAPQQRANWAECMTA